MDYSGPRKPDQVINEGPTGPRTERTMKSICLTSVAMAIAACFSAAEAAVSDCPVPPGAVKVALPAGLPAALRDARGDVALPGEPFDSIDVFVKGHKHRRYIFVWSIGNRWITAVEQGGIALRGVVSVYELGKDGKTAVLVEEHITFPNSVCADATRLAGSSKK